MECGASLTGLAPSTMFFFPVRPIMAPSQEHMTAYNIIGYNFKEGRECTGLEFPEKIGHDIQILIDLLYSIVSADGYSHKDAAKPHLCIRSCSFILAYLYNTYICLTSSLPV